MNKFKLSLWWMRTNYVQLITICFLIFFAAQISRLIFNF